MRKPATENAKSLSAEAYAELVENANYVLAECRRQLLSPARSPFVGSIAMNLEIIPVRDRRCPTAATDGKHIYFDIDFLSRLSPEDRLFVFAHEIWHNALSHFNRMGGRDQRLANIAEDLEVNQLLKEDGYAVPKEGLMPQMFNLPPNLSAEEYYEKLLKQAQSKGGSGSGNGSGSSNGSKGNKSDLSGQFDKHLQPSYDPDADNSGENTCDKYGKVGEDPNFKPELSEADIKRNTEKMRELVVSAAQQVERQRGTLPAHLKSLVKDLLEPEIPWQEKLIQFVTRAVGDKNRWSRPNRRFIHHGIYLPSKDGEKIKIAVGIDTSGSTAGDITKFLSEVNAIVKSYGNYEVHLIQCDAEIQDYTLYNEDNPLDIEHTGFEVSGGGGTSMTPIIKHIEENELDVDCITIFTDGYIEEMNENEAPEIPVLWVVTEDGSTSAIHYGEILKFKNPRKSEAA